MDEIVQRSEAFGLSLNTAKTKTMVFSKHPVTLTLRVSDENIEQVSSIKYLGTILNDNGNTKQEIRSRIEQARRSFLDMKNVFTRTELNLDLRVRMVRCYIFCVLLYGCESWAPESGDRKENNLFRDVSIQKNSENPLDTKNNQRRSTTQNG